MQGLVKLKEALGVLVVQQRFNINEKPAAMPVSDAACADVLGVPPSHRGVVRMTAIRTQWEAHCSAWTAPPPAPPPTGRKKARIAAGALSVLSASAVWVYWLSLASSAPELSYLALLHWLSPISSASVERIFSYLTALDTPQRRLMDVTTLTMILFLRANWRITELLRIDLAALIAAVGGPPDRGAAAAAAVLTAAAAAALHAVRAASAAEAAADEVGDAGEGGEGGF